MRSDGVVGVGCLLSQYDSETHWLDGFVRMSLRLSASLFLPLTVSHCQADSG